MFGHIFFPKVFDQFGAPPIEFLLCFVSKMPDLHLFLFYCFHKPIICIVYFDISCYWNRVNG